MGRNCACLLIGIALGLLVLPIWWVIAAVFAALWHEGCHYLAVRLSGGQAVGLRVGHLGAVMEVRGLLPKQELVCALAGPMGSLFLLAFVRWLPRTAICAGFQGLYNLLPIFPLDGGRAVRCLTQLVLPPIVANKACFWLEQLCLTGLILLSIYGCFGLHLGVTPLLVGVVIIWRIKIPCKPWRNSVQ